MKHRDRHEQIFILLKKEFDDLRDKLTNNKIRTNIHKEKIHRQKVVNLITKMQNTLAKIENLDPITQDKIIKLIKQIECYLDSLIISIKP